jgi:hypothetical protein
MSKWEKELSAKGIFFSGTVLKIDTQAKTVTIRGSEVGDWEKMEVLVPLLLFGKKEPKEKESVYIGRKKWESEKKELWFGEIMPNLKWEDLFEYSRQDLLNWATRVDL